MYYKTMEYRSMKPAPEVLKEVYEKNQSFVDLVAYFRQMNLWPQDASPNVSPYGDCLVSALLTLPNHPYVVMYSVDGEMSYFMVDNSDRRHQKHQSRWEQEKVLSNSSALNDIQLVRSSLIDHAAYSSLMLKTTKGYGATQQIASITEPTEERPFVTFSAIRSLSQPEVIFQPNSSSNIPYVRGTFIVA